MLVHKAYRYELDPNNYQRNSLLQHAGVARFVYNWALDQRIKLYKNNQGNDRFTDRVRKRIKHEYHQHLYIEMRIMVILKKPDG